MKRRTNLLLVGALALGLPSLASARVNFKQEVLPIFKEKCLECHSSLEKKPKGGFRLDNVKYLYKGGETGRAIVPRKPEKSLLYELVSLPHDDEDLMPPEGKARPLTEKELAIIKTWILEGARTDGWKETIAREVVPSREIKKQRVQNMAESYPTMKAEREVIAAARQVESLLEKGRKANQLKKLPEISDEVFVRRIYIDVAGRIPTVEELGAFLKDDRSDRREKLIDQLLGSEAFVSHFYNYWADVFRIQERGDQALPTRQFAQWLKDGIRENKPYNKLVHEVLASTGNAIENPAVGYWYRDYRMPLDNMAYTTQVFLGTQLDCAMCHDHPFDQWTQLEFFQMAGYIHDQKMTGYTPKWVALKDLKNPPPMRERITKDVDGEKIRFWRDIPKDSKKFRYTRTGDWAELAKTHSMDEIMTMEKDAGVANYFSKHVEQYFEEQRDRYRKNYKSMMTMEGKSGDNQRLDSQAASMAYNAHKLLYQDMRRGDKPQAVLPRDYKYDNAEPNTKVEAAPLYGKDTGLEPGTPPHLAMANWIASPDNPKFNRMIANRMFTYVFGIGLYPKHDDLKETDISSNPELVSLLEKQIMASDYDLKRFLKMLYCTPTYQSEVYRPAPDAENKARPSFPYYYPGPLIKRMSAEQIWDSFMAMIVPEIDQRERNFTFKNREAFKDIADLRPEEVTEFCKTYLQSESEKAYKQLVEDFEAQNGESIRRAKAAGKKVRYDRKDFEKRLKPKKYTLQYQDPRFKSYSKEFYRASELPQPQKPGHFLREFGQSDREQIENANRLSNVPQHLQLMNRFVDAYIFRESYRGKVGAKIWDETLSRDGFDRVKHLYLGILSREPGENDVKDLRAFVDPSSKDDLRDLAWALVNSEEFRFVY